MRALLILLCILSFFTFSGIVYAYYDDSVVIEIGDVLPTESTSSPTSDTLQGGGSSSTNPPAGAADSGPDAGNTNTASGGNLSGPGNNTVSGNSGSLEYMSPSETTSVVNGLFDILVAGGAINKEQGGASNSSDQNSPNSSAADSNVNSDGGSASGGPVSGNVPGNDSANAGGNLGGNGAITINAAKVRKTLLGRLSFQQILDEYSARIQSHPHGKALSNRDLGLMAASTILYDSNIEEITIGARRFEIVYRSQGYLLGFIPKSFPVHIAVSPQAATLQGRVDIVLPWYRFFLRRFFDNTSLAQEIDTVLGTEGAPQQGDSASDVQQRLFDAVSLLLKKKVGTIHSSIQKS